MRYAILGDIHANVEALTAVIRKAVELDAEVMVCTGDIVGYGAAPKECIEIISENQLYCVKGNHDEYTCNSLENLNIRAEAKTVIQWTQSVLPKEYIEWLDNLPYSIELEDFEVVHASYIPQPAWEYVVDEISAVENFLFQKKQIAFNGHTHIPVHVSHTPWEKPNVEFLHDMIIPHNQQSLIGVGSVGQPRDEDPRACLVIFDSETREINIHRVNYDIATAKERIRQNGLPKVLMNRLMKGQ